VKRPRLKTALLPAGSNPLAVKVGKKLRLYRKGKGLTYSRAGAQLGISPGHYRWLEEGRIVPGPQMAKRLRLWMMGNVSFEGAPPLSEAQFRVTREALKFRKIVLSIPIEDAQGITRRAKALGMSGSALIHLIIRQFLKNQVAFVTLKDAIDEVNQTRAIMALQEAPELRDILLAEIPLLLKAGGEATPWHEHEEMRPEIEKAAEVKISVDRLDLHQVQLEDQPEEV
jgi:transcriptional regulator with XRE-family HTH domain